MHSKLIALVVVAVAVLAAAKPLTELKFSVANLDPESINCDATATVEQAIDECGLQQGYSHRFEEFAYPQNHTFLMASCNRQKDAFKCLRAYAKCLPPLTKQVLLAMVSSRQRYNKKICDEKQTESATKLIELVQCMHAQQETMDKGLAAELSSIVTPEAIVNSKIGSLQERLKHSCCSVAKVRKEFMDSTMPHCKQYTQVASEIIDSYLAETVTLICPGADAKQGKDCDKLQKLNTPKSSESRFFLRPIINVVKTLEPKKD